MKAEMKKKVLFTSHLANFVKFNRPFMQWFKSKGWEVHYASLGEESVPDCDKNYKVSFNRSPFSLDNLRAYRQLKEIIREEQYDLIHCHTPMGGVVTRLATRFSRKKGLKVVYTAHGFHFFKGAQLRNWLLYYPVEKLLSHFTDCLVLMNHEDYDTAKRKRFAAGDIRIINGVGVDINCFKPAIGTEKESVRQELGLGSKDFVLIYIAEFIHRKNHKFLIKCFAEIKQKIPAARLVLVGSGELFDKCKSQCLFLDISNEVLFSGYRRDVNRICQAADVLVSTSRQEGLPVNILEGMASGLPVACTAIRGQVDVITPGANGFLFQQGDMEAFCNAVCRLYENHELRHKIGNRNLVDVKRYSVENAVKEMAGIYESVLRQK